MMASGDSPHYLQANPLRISDDNVFTIAPGVRDGEIESWRGRCEGVRDVVGLVQTRNVFV